MATHPLFFLAEILVGLLLNQYDKSYQLLPSQKGKDKEKILQAFTFNENVIQGYWSDHCIFLKGPSFDYVRTKGLESAFRYGNFPYSMYWNYEGVGGSKKNTLT